MDKENITNSSSITQTSDEINPKLIALVADQITALNGTIIKFIIVMIIFTVFCLFNIISDGVVYIKMDKVEHDNSLTKKYVWELKRSLDLEFSGDRSEEVE